MPVEPDAGHAFSESYVSTARQIQDHFHSETQRRRRKELDTLNPCRSTWSNGGLETREASARRPVQDLFLSGSPPIRDPPREIDKRLSTDDLSKAMNHAMAG